METTTHTAPRMLAALMVAHGVRDVVICPGTRNAPLIIAVSRTPELKITSVIDERSGAFIALGIARQTGRPVAVICTSGSAVLNFAPAISEAYYRNIPLIAISADRPAAWIGQNDSQTIRQPGVMDNIVKSSVDISADSAGKDFVWFTNRRLNDILLMATDPLRPGPVHINIQLEQPLGQTDTFADEKPTVISRILPEQKLPVSQINILAEEIKDKKIAVVVGFHSPDSKLNRALMRLSSRPNVVVFHEAQSNVFGLSHAVFNVDAVISSLSDQDKDDLMPDIILTLGGSVVSSNLKNWLRSSPRTTRHWAVGYGTDGSSVDVFGRLTKRIEVAEVPFISALAGALRREGSSLDYSVLWENMSRDVADKIDIFTSGAEWCDLVAVRKLIAALPSDFNLEVSNGMSIRYIQMCDYRHLHSVESNRGVSGIDGSTSTAIGAAINYPHPTVLLSGDMSAQYDLGAFASSCISPRFKMAVLNNSGGDIFRFIATTGDIPECEELLAVGTNLNISDICKAFGFSYLLADSPESMNKALSEFITESTRPAILEIRTSSTVNAPTLRNLFKTLKNKSL